MDTFSYTGRKTNEISFPLGGIGAGCIGLAGNGRLIDWEIFNRPNKGSLNGMSHFAIKAEKDGEVVDARLLLGDLAPPYTGEMARAALYNGFGWGPRVQNLCGMPHFREHRFTGRFPNAEIVFSGEKQFPGAVSLHAWSPLIPGNDHDSSLPAAFFEIKLVNTTETELDYTVVGALSNPFGHDEYSQNSVLQRDHSQQLTLRNGRLDPVSPEYGDITLGTDADPDSISFQEYWYRGLWTDDLEVYRQDLTTPGRFRNRIYTQTDPKGSNPDTGHLAVHFTLQPGERRRVRYVISWHVPTCTNFWRVARPRREGEDYAHRITEAGFENKWRNWYATQWENSLDSGRYALENWGRLHEETRRFQGALFASSLPSVVIEAVSANLSTLKSPTCLRLEDGTFYGFEGVAVDIGSCEGSCTHVWNYAQALPFLFPSLERSMRNATYAYSVDEFGGSHFRLLLPLGLQADPGDDRPCPDGQFGDVLKTYRDWKICGDSDWLRGLWPSLRRTLEYAWSEQNRDQWDPDKTGVLWGRQHHTLDLELFGANAWLTGYYLAALKAAGEMATVCHDPVFGEECRALFEKGKAWVDQHLFNGDYYHQQIDFEDREMLKKFDSDPVTTEGAKASERYWSGEHGEISYQIGEGCEIDMTIAQWHANLYGLGEIFDPGQTQRALAATYRHNFKASMRDASNTWRVYALNDESAMHICTWPEGTRRPRIPLPYAPEDMGGFTYAIAVQMIQSGLVEEGLRLVRAVRDRYDGEKRNPWNEIECGSNYARSMASYALLNAFSGFEFDQVKGFIGFKPVRNGREDFRCFWALDGAWGEVVYSGHQVLLRILSGSLRLQSCDFNLRPRSVEIDGAPVDWTPENTKLVFTQTQPVQQTVKLE